MRKTLSYTPTVAKWLPRENFCWCSRPLHPTPPHLFILIPPTQTQPAPSPPLWQDLGVQRSFCLGGKVTWPRLQSKVHSTFSLGHQCRGQMKGCSPGKTAEWNQREGRCFARFLALFRAQSENMCFCFHKNIKSHSSPAFPFYWFSIQPCCQLWVVSAKGRKEEREETASFKLSYNSCVLISVLSSWPLTSCALEGCLSML